MHIAFIPYGERNELEKFAQSLECQSYQLILTRKQNEKKVQWIFGGIRVTPLGVWEYIIPKDYEQVVLNTLRFNQDVPYGMGLKAKALRKILKYKKAPKVTTNQTFIWRMDNIAIVPVGVRYDDTLTYKEGPLEGWSHEAI